MAGIIIKHHRSTPPLIAALVGDPAPLATATKMDSQLWSNLQHHAPLALDKVFAKLPFRHFFQAKLVCREWNRLGCDQTFLDQHVAKTSLQSPHFCLMHPGGDWQIILTHDDVEDAWQQMPMPLPFRQGHRATCYVDGFLLISYPEHVDREGEGCGKYVVLNVRTRMQHVLPPQYIDGCVVQYECVDGLVVSKGGDAFQVVSGVSDLRSWHTSVYSSETNTWEVVTTQSGEVISRHPQRCHDSVRFRSSVCCKDKLYSYCEYEEGIMVYDLALGEWSCLEVPSQRGRIHFGVWEDVVYACCQMGMFLNVFKLQQMVSKWEQLSTLDSWCYHLEYDRENAEITFCEQYMLVHCLWDVPERYDERPRRFSVYNLETRRWKYVEVPISREKNKKA